MRIVGIVTLLAIAAGCGAQDPAGEPGTGGFMRRPGTGGAPGVGGGPCDQACQADLLWQRYVAATEAVTAAQTTYTDAYRAAWSIGDANWQGHCSTKPPPCPYLTGDQYAMGDPTVMADQQAVSDATAARDALYNAYVQAAVVAGMTPMAKIQ